MRAGEVRHPERARFGKPLDGVRVLALEQMQALPFATQLFAHLGADVVKVEHPRDGESGRASRPQIRDADGRAVGATYLRNNLSKRSLALDWKHPAGRDLLLRLVPHFDVVAENFRPGALARAGLDYASLSPRWPRLVYVSISGFGHLAETPYATRPAYAPVAEAMAGLYEPLRKPGEPPPVVVAGALGDNASALYAVIGTLAALRQRDRTGIGQHVDVAMFDSMIAMTDLVPFMWSLGEPPSAATAGRTGLVAAFAARDGHFVVAVFRDHQFARLAALVGHPEWVGDPRFATREGWALHRDDVVRPALERWARERTKQEAAAALCAEGVPAGPSNEAADLIDDPHVQNRDMLIEVPRPDGARPMLVAGNPVKLSRVSEGPVSASPRLGEHTAAVLREALGLGDAELASLRAQGAIGPAPSDDRAPEER
ncbi:MAG TPA: CoA transferase [Myxococcota bacterium]|nr:CoA transferase [Myxococcota bacterium]